MTRNCLFGLILGLGLVACRGNAAKGDADDRPPISTSASGTSISLEIRSRTGKSHRITEGIATVALTSEPSADAKANGALVILSSTDNRYVGYDHAQLHVPVRHIGGGRWVGARSFNIYKGNPPRRTVETLTASIAGREAVLRIPVDPVRIVKFEPDPIQVEGGHGFFFMFELAEGAPNDFKLRAQTSSVDLMWFPILWFGTVTNSQSLSVLFEPHQYRKRVSFQTAVTSGLVHQKMSIFDGLTLLGSVRVHIRPPS